jgi:hypothetical protein
MVNRPLNIEIDWNAIFTSMALFMLVLALTRFSMRLLGTSKAEQFLQTIGERRKLKFAREPIRDIDQDTFLEWIESGKVELLQGGGPSPRGYKPTLIVMDDKIYAVVRHIVKSEEVLKAGVRLLSADYRDVAEETLGEAEEHGLLLPEVKLLPQLKEETAPRKVIVECPLCGEIIEIPEYDTVTRTEALKRHIKEKHSGKRGKVQPATIPTKPCPKCGKPLHLRFVSKLNKYWWVHEYPMGRVMTGEKLCDYSEKAKPDEIPAVIPTQPSGKCYKPDRYTPGSHDYS